MKSLTKYNQRCVFSLKAILSTCISWHRKHMRWMFFFLFRDRTCPVQHPFRNYRFHKTFIQTRSTKYYYTPMLINSWAKVIKWSLLFCRVVCASCDSTLCKFFCFYKLVIWIGRKCVSRHTKPALSVLCSFPFIGEEQDIYIYTYIYKKKKSHLRIKLLKREGKREDQVKKAICITEERSKIFYSFLLLSMQRGFRK